MNTGVLSHKLKIAPIWENLLPFTYVLYHEIRMFHQCYHLQSIGYTAHQRVMGHIYTAVLISEITSLIKFFVI